MKQTAQKLAAGCGAAVLGFCAVTASAEPVQDPDFSDVIVLYSDEAAEEAPADPLCSVINETRAANGAAGVEMSEELMEKAMLRVAALDGTHAPADASTVGYAHASETVIRGRADLNTMISAILISEKQTRNLTDSDYMMFGYACNESQTLWVLLMARPQDVHLTDDMDTTVRDEI